MEMEMAKRISNRNQKMLLKEKKKKKKMAKTLGLPEDIVTIIMKYKIFLEKLYVIDIYYVNNTAKLIFNFITPGTSISRCLDNVIVGYLNSLRLSYVTCPLAGFDVKIREFAIHGLIRYIYVSRKNEFLVGYINAKKTLMLLFNGLRITWEFDDHTVTIRLFHNEIYNLDVDNFNNKSPDEIWQEIHEISRLIIIIYETMGLHVLLYFADIIVHRDRDKLKEFEENLEKVKKILF